MASATNPMACSPRTRGWTGERQAPPGAAAVFPAHAGMDRPGLAWQGEARQCSPRTRGWTAMEAQQPGQGGVFPAHAGMDRHHRLSLLPRHACSPRTRGWTAIRGIVLLSRLVFPAHAGMDRSKMGKLSFSRRVPRARGDGPLIFPAASSWFKCSPRTRGWTGPDGLHADRQVVFPAHAGMDRCCSCRPLPSRRVPRARGDGPVAEGNYG